ncbi:hypothetical protein ACOI1C_11725 [Bacillus sp. DJP31]|uniref:hypothetical protein n=1 Tax=Bacillus sp. DJP31 TaxID=3409789 RepID=UPI003BB559F2
MWRKYFLGFTCLVILLSINIGTSVSAESSESIVSMAAYPGECVIDKTDLQEFLGLDSVDLLARVIYAGAQGETLEGKRGVAHVVKNRKDKNLSTFGGNTYAGVI